MKEGDQQDSPPLHRRALAPPPTYPRHTTQYPKEQPRKPGVPARPELHARPISSPAKGRSRRLPLSGAAPGLPRLLVPGPPSSCRRNDPFPDQRFRDRGAPPSPRPRDWHLPSSDCSFLPAVSWMVVLRSLELTRMPEPGPRLSLAGHHCLDGPDGTGERAGRNGLDVVGGGGRPRLLSLATGELRTECSRQPAWRKRCCLGPTISGPTFPGRLPTVSSSWEGETIGKWGEGAFLCPKLNTVCETQNIHCRAQ